MEKEKYNIYYPLIDCYRIKEYQYDNVEKDTDTEMKL